MTKKTPDQIGGGVPGPGRPKGSKGQIPYGARKAVREVGRYRRSEKARQKEISQAAADGQVFEKSDPNADEMIGIILQIARGEVRGRWLGFRLAAASRILEEARGKPVQKIESKLTGTLAALVGASLSVDDSPGPPKLLHAVDSDAPITIVSKTVRTKKGA